jgi:hypothetical protein
MHRAVITTAAQEQSNIYKEQSTILKFKKFSIHIRKLFIK